MKWKRKCFSNQTAPDQFWLNIIWFNTLFSITCFEAYFACAICLSFDIVKLTDQLQLLGVSRCYIWFWSPLTSAHITTNWQFGDNKGLCHLTFLFEICEKWVAFEILKLNLFFDGVHTQYLYKLWAELRALQALLKGSETQVMWGRWSAVSLIKPLRIWGGKEVEDVNLCTQLISFSELSWDGRALQALLKRSRDQALSRWSRITKWRTEQFKFS